MKALKNYHGLYLKCDMLFLATFFEIFRNKSFENHGFCPSNYLSTPALSWDAMFNRTKDEVELISGRNMYLFSGKGMRDRVSYISKRYSKVNNM